VKKFWMSFLLVPALSACTSKVFDGPMQLSGKWVSSDTLNLGHDTYMNHCMQCHGIDGDGKGPASPGMKPPPRSFRYGKAPYGEGSGVFIKFANVTSGEMPNDDDLKRIVRYGLRGTPMLPWDISDERLEAVVQYIKTFAPTAWKEPGATPVKLTSDPWTGREQEAIALGKKLYHGVAQCFSCHPAYASLEEISAASKEFTGNPIDSIRENPHLSENQDSSYGVKFMPPDFTKSWIRSGNKASEIYRLLGAGVGGTTMASWKTTLSMTGDEKEAEERLWAVAHYVESLHQLKYDDKARQTFFTELNAKRAAK